MSLQRFIMATEILTGGMNLAFAPWGNRWKRMRKAVQLLEQGFQVTEVCYSVGYNDLTHFSREFKKMFGAKPSCYRADKYRTERLTV